MQSSLLRRLLLSLALCLSTAVPAFAQLEPAEAAKQIVAAPGLRVQLVAHEPDVVAPTAIDVDEQGRVWVAEGVNYRNASGQRIKEPPFFPNPRRKTGDRIVVHEDTNGDGQLDKSRVFYEGLDINSPQGLAVFGGKVWISQSPSIRTIEIKPDGTAGKVETLLTGFGGIHGDHSVHSVYLGPDGKLYGCYGNTHTVLSLPDGKKIDNWSSGAKGGAVFRMNLDATEFEILGDNFRNGYEAATDSFGRTFYSDNDDDEGNLYCRLVYVMQGGNFGHQPQPPRGLDWNMERPGVIPLLMRTGAGAPAGLCVYEGKLLADKWLGAPMLAETGRGELLGFRLSPDGAGFRVAGVALEDGRQTINSLRQTRQPDVLLRSDDRWFRPSDVAVAPDGSVFVSDFYNHIAGGRKLDLPPQGRIYRILPAEHDGSYVVPKTDWNDAKQVAGALESPNVTKRARAALRLRDMGAEAVPLLEAQLKQDDPRLVARAIFQLASLGDAGRKAAMQGLAHKSDEVRAATVQALATHGGVPADTAARLVKDPSPAVRRELLLALRGGEANDAAAQQIVDLALQYDGYDRYYLEAVLLAAKGKDAVRKAILDQIASRTDRTAAGLRWGLDAPGSLEPFVKTTANADAPAADRAAAAELLAMYAEPAAGEALLKLLAPGTNPEVVKPALVGLAKNIENRWKSLAGGGDLLAAVQPWTDVAATKEAALNLAAALGTRALTQWRLSPPYPAAQAEGFEKVFPPELSDAELSLADWAPAKAKPDGVIDLAAQRKPSSNVVGYAVTLIDAAQPVETRLLAGSDDGIKIWVNGKLVHSNNITRSVGPRMDKAPVKLEAGLNRILVKVNQGSGGWGFVVEVEDPLGVLTEIPAGEASQLADPKDRLDPTKLPPAAELLALAGDSSRGRSVFFRATAACTKCHSIGKQGAKTTALGPALDGIGKKMGRDGLLESIIQPEAKVQPQWVAWTIITTSGKTHVGLVPEETGDQITLVDITGRRVTIPKADIDERQPSKLSIMPQQLVANLTPQDLADLLEFLVELK